MRIESALIAGFVAFLCVVVPTLMVLRHRDDKARAARATCATRVVTNYVVIVDKPWSEVKDVLERARQIEITTNTAGEL